MRVPTVLKNVLLVKISKRGGRAEVLSKIKIQIILNNFGIGKISTNIYA